jgi:formate dehydrogenase subunit gamma
MPRSSSIDDLRGMPSPAPGAIPKGAAPVPEAWQDALDRALAGHGVHVPDVPNGAATALLPILHHLQDALGFVPPALVPLIARALNLSRAEVHGVVTYYHHFRHEPPGRHVVQLCQAEACRACGGEALMAHAAAALHCAPGATRADGAVTLEATYCLGLCAIGPSAMVDGALQARLTPAAIDAIAKSLGENA